MTAISLREAANRARLTASIHSNPAEQVRWLALATLLDGDGEGGLLGEHEWFAEDVQRAENAMLSEPERIGAAIWYQVAQATYAASKRYLTLVAAYVSAVLGQEVTA